MGSGRIASATAVGLALAFVLALGLDPGAPTADAPAAAPPPTTTDAEPPQRPAPQPDIPVPAAVTTAAGALDTGPRELIAYTIGCGEIRAAEPRSERGVYTVDGLGGACEVQWQPSGGIAGISKIDGSNDLLLADREGRGSSFHIEGRDLVGPVAFTDGAGFLACTSARSGVPAPVIYRSASAGAALEPWHHGCYPAVARDGTVAWASPAVDGGLGTSELSELHLAAPGGEERVVARFPGRSIFAVAFTGDGEHVIANVTGGDAQSEIDAIDRAGGLRVLQRGQGLDLRAWPSPVGAQVLIGNQTASGAASVRVIDALSGNQEWLAPTAGLAEAAWAPNGSRLLLSDRNGWVFVEPGSGRPGLRLDRLGNVPTWCCPVEPE